MDKEVLIKGAKKFQVSLSDLHLVGGYSNNVYEYRGSKGSFILKFYLSPNDDLNAIQSELDWIVFLYRAKMNVAAPRLSRNGNYIETIEFGNGEVCYAVAFQKVQGTFINTQNKNEWNPKFFNRYGQTLGIIHSLAKQYKPSHDSDRRKEWNQGILFSEKMNIDDDIDAKWSIYVNKLKKLPKDQHSYGLIHGDLHHHNFFVHHNELVLFDFGDCEYHWFVYDIAIVIYHAIQATHLRDELSKNYFSHKFIKSFLKGYLTENHLSKDGLHMLTFFLNYRQLYSYLYFTKTLLNKKDITSNIKEKIEMMRDRIVNDKPFVELDLRTIY